MKPIVICGPTASGKTDLALEIARQTGGIIISADSRQVYKHLTVGTAKPQGTYQNGLYTVQGVPYLLVDFLDVTAVAQSAPGIMAINVAILTGYRLQGGPGAAFAACGAALPSFIIILGVALFFRQFAENAVVVRLFKGIRPAVVALIMVPVFTLAESAGVTIKTVWVSLAVALAVWLLGVSPVYVVLVAILCGLLFTKKEQPR